MLPTSALRAFAVAAAIGFIQPMGAAAAPAVETAATAAPLRADQSGVLYRILLGAGWHGLEVADYLTPQLDQLLASADPAARRLGEAQLFEAAARYAHDLRRGRTPPSAFVDAWAIRPAAFDARAELTAAASADSLEPWFASLAPPHDGYRQLLPQLARYQQIVLHGGWKALDARKPLKPGGEAEGVPALRERLLAEGVVLDRPDNPRLYDEALTAAVAAFQARRGLAVDGVAGRATLLALNVPAEARLAAIRANLERWRWAPRTLPATRIEVNIAAAALQALEGGRLVLEMPTVVGRPADPTPMFADEIEAVVFNPPWNVPQGIAQREILPKAAKDPGYMAREGFVWIQGGGGRRLQQKAGPTSALGRYKFDLPNRFNVYLHDTPNHTVFARPARALSHGCVRLHDPRALALWLLGRQGWDGAAVDAAVEAGGTASVRLNAPTPVYLFYFTAFVDKDGALNFRDDIYGWDRSAMAAL